MNTDYILAKLTFHYENHFYEYNGLINLNLKNGILSLSFRRKDEEWFTHNRTFQFNKMFLIHNTKFSKKIHKLHISKNYHECICKGKRGSYVNVISGYNGYILCGDCMGKTKM